MTYHFLAMTPQEPPYTRLVTKPQNLSMRAKNTVETTVVTMTTTVPLVTSVRLGGAAGNQEHAARPPADDAGQRHDDLVARIADDRLVVLELEPAGIEHLRHHERDEDAGREVGREHEPARAELRRRHRRHVVLGVVAVTRLDRRRLGPAHRERLEGRTRLGPRVRGARAGRGLGPGLPCFSVAV